MGPKTTRLDPASQPSLTGPGLNLLQSIFGPQGGAGSTNFGAGPSMQQRTGLGAFGTLLRQQNPLGAPPQMGAPGAPGSDILSRLGNVFGSPIQGGFDQFSGQANLDAYQPIFQRGLQDAIALNREQGPRFASGQGLLGMQTTQRALQDYNSFAQNVLQQGQATKLQAMLGAGQQQGQLLQQLLAALFTGGGINAAPIYQQTPGLGQQLLSLGGTLGGALLGGAGGAAAGSQLGGAVSRNPYTL